MKTQVQILDCTFRDGGYINDWNFDRKLVRETYRALSQAGVDYVELGYRSRPPTDGATPSGPWKYTTEEDLRQATAHITGAKVALMGDQGKIKAEDFCDAKDSVVSLVRIAAHKAHIKEGIALLEKLKKMGYQVSLNAMGYSNYAESERKEFAATVKAAEFLDYVYIADSYGSLFPGQIKPLFEPLLGLSHTRLGFHPHNNLQMAFANTLEAIAAGVHIVDSTVYGMGRSAGNLQTEILVSYLEKEDADRYNGFPLLNIIDRFFLAMNRENPWGYQLPYMLSGMFQCHPDYAKALLGQREYTIEDIWKALDHIKRQPAAGGFSKDVLNAFISQGHLSGDPAAKELPAAPAGVRPAVSYAGRHKGRTFLVLANGPSIKEYKPKIDRFIEKHDPIVLGANYLGGIFKPHYHAFNNKRRFMEYAESVSPDAKLLLGQYLPEVLIKDYIRRPYETLYYQDGFADFGIDHGVIAANCRTISILLLGVAVVMGAKRVFAAGLDGYLDVKDLHFYQEKNDLEDQEMKVEKQRWCQKYLRQIDDHLRRNDKEELHILTPTSYKQFHKGIDNYL